MTDKLKPNNLKEVYILFVRGLPALDAQSKEEWVANFDFLTEEECTGVMDSIFDQSMEFIERARVELIGNDPEIKNLLAMEKQAKTLLAEVNQALVSLKMAPLKK